MSENIKTNTTPILGEEISPSFIDEQPPIASIVSERVADDLGGELATSASGIAKKARDYVQTSRARRGAALQYVRVDYGGVPASPTARFDLGTTKEVVDFKAGKTKEIVITTSVANLLSIPTLVRNSKAERLTANDITRHHDALLEWCATNCRGSFSLGVSDRWHEPAYMAFAYPNDAKRFIAHRSGKIERPVASYRQTLVDYDRLRCGEWVHWS